MRRSEITIDLGALRRNVARLREVPIMILAPSAFAIWIAAMPMPDAAALTSTASPALKPPAVMIASCAVMKTLGKAAASAQLRFAGTVINARGSTST